MESRIAWGALGVASAAVAIGVGEIVAGVLGGVSLVAAIGALVISLQPAGAKDLVVAIFGTNDKLALEVGVVTGGLVVGGLLGLVARRDIRVAYVGFVAAGIAALFVLMNDPLAEDISALLTVCAATAAGLALLTWLASVLRPGRNDDERPVVPGRRGFVAMAATFIGVGGVLAIVGRLLSVDPRAAAAESVAIPPARETVAPVATGAELGIDGLTPIVVPNDDFYRIDTRLGTPAIDAASWSLRIHGMVDREVTLDYAQLLAMPLIERYVTIACVSNEVGGRLVGNARWTGVRLRSVLDMAGMQPGASQLVGRSFDGWTAGFPTAHLDGAGRDSLIAVAMNGEPLPANHGFPARLIVPGLYGYVSATKWITQIELTTLEAFDAYWVPLGWAKEAPILTQSRVELPRPGASVTAGDVLFAGVAWAPTRGISRVEVELDQSGTWLPAALSAPLSGDAWVQWHATLPVASGVHVARVRATDGTGALQEPGPTPPAPDGARGYHRISFAAA
jgi:DMSO/TMAO reductase YedYZ molybdopterin-dependent catalytic subunit